MCFKYLVVIDLHILTENDQKADKNRRQCAHAQLERLSLLD